MHIWSLFLLLIPLLSTAQLKEFEVSEMERPDVAVVQANAQWPDDALLLVYSSLKDLNFRSSLGGIDKVSYNPKANRYEILFKPNKQMLFVYANNFVEQKIETFNPNPKDVYYYKVEEKQQAVVNTKPGTLKIVTEPSGADVFINGIQTVNKTPFTGELPSASYNIKLQKAKYETIDTLVAVKGGEPAVVNLQMKSTTREHSALPLPTEIGQLYGGGIVFDISEDGHGLVVSKEDLSNGDTWHTAKNLCNAYDSGGNVDWFLPSKSDLEKLWLIKKTVNNKLRELGETEIGGKWYWSSLEFNKNEAWHYFFGEENYAYHDVKHMYYSVRAIRAF